MTRLGRFLLPYAFCRPSCHTFRPELTSLTPSVACSQAGTHQEEAESVRSAQAAAAKTQRELTELQAQLSSLTNQNASYARLLVRADATEWFALFVGVIDWGKGSEPEPGPEPEPEPELEAGT